ncbi:myelin-oligodendrocyte glycoprotein-like isoform X2 [Micropterus salmoides]|uniref:myelin-oligodendrocyte glycoprotein-like isoform X2 n=1 Tax=Micropterus salmoides TaxID=27706 RepID=UPI0018EDA0AE|nr:myelin-oligodendrocyte glycoprotein-like isoform X2 [Micropterus salmoides]
MICSILLLISLTSCVCGTFIVNVTQTSYQAEENGNATLEWTFTTKTDNSLNSLSIFCELFTDRGSSVLYHLHEGVEVPESQGEQFAGRVQCDKDVLREGRIRLHVSRLRTEDSGEYVCEVKTSYGGSLRKSRLTVSGEPQVICPNPTIQAVGGDTVTLPCYLDPPHSVVDYAVDWTRVDLNKVVYSYRHKQESHNDQMDQYRDRTTLHLEDLSRGNLTLQISSVQLADSGPYRCFVSKLRISCVTEVIVSEQDGGKRHIIHAGIISSLVVLLGVLIVLLVKYKLKKRLR